MAAGFFLFAHVSHAVIDFTLTNEGPTGRHVFIAEATAYGGHLFMAAGATTLMGLDMGDGDVTTIEWSEDGDKTINYGSITRTINNGLEAKISSEGVFVQLSAPPPPEMEDSRLMLGILLGWFILWSMSRAYEMARR